MLEDKFNIPDETYWTNPWENRKDIQRPLMHSGEETFIIGSPTKVALNQHKDIPLAILNIKKVFSEDTTDFKSTAIATAINTSTSELHAKLVFEPSESEAESASKGNGDPTAMISEASTINLADTLELPENAANYIVSLISLDKISNRCQVKLVDSAAYEDPAIEAYMQELRAQNQPPVEITPAANLEAELPSYEKLANSPEIPTDTRIELSASRVTPTFPESQCLVHGSFRLKIKTHNLYKEPTDETAEKPQPKPTAIVPISLMLTGSVDPEPIIIELQIPSYSAVEEVGDDKIAAGYFAFDISELAELKSTPQTYFIYAFASDQMAGPIPAAFVEVPEELREASKPQETDKKTTPSGETAEV